MITSRKTIYNGPAFDLEKLEITTPDGLNIKRDLVHHNPVVAILAQNGATSILVNEYRVGTNKEDLSLPAGFINGNEDAIHAACREFTEETGLTLINPKEILTLQTSPGMTDEVAHIVVGEFVDNGETQHFDSDEYVNVVKTSEDLMDLINNGEITNAISVAAITKREFDELQRWL